MDMTEGYTMKINMNIAIIMAILLVVSGCNFGTTAKQTQSVQSTAGASCGNGTCGVDDAQTSAKAEVQKVEIYHFHGTIQCYSCKTVGAYAEETIISNYLGEIQSGRIVFASINYDLPENKELAVKYGASGSSLWIGVYDAAGFHPEQNTNVWYKINDKQDYMTYLKGVIDKRLAGDFS
jgi:hypothetical protein